MQRQKPYNRFTDFGVSTLRQIMNDLTASDTMYKHLKASNTNTDTNIKKEIIINNSNIYQWKNQTRLNLGCILSDGSC